MRWLRWGFRICLAVVAVAIVSAICPLLTPEVQLIAGYIAAPALLVGAAGEGGFMIADSIKKNENAKEEEHLVAESVANNKGKTWKQNEIIKTLFKGVSVNKALSDLKSVKQDLEKEKKKRVKCEVNTHKKYNTLSNNQIKITDRQDRLDEKVSTLGQLSSSIHTMYPAPRGKANLAVNHDVSTNSAEERRGRNYVN